MNRVILGAAMLALVSTAAQARHGHHHNGRHHNRHAEGAAPAGIVTIETAAGSVRVAGDMADQVVGIASELVEAGFDGEIACYARSGHIRGSRHYSGHACDFAQRARNKTVALMYVAGEIIERWGLRDGCTFRRPDCGHADDGKPRGRRMAERRAKRRHRA